MELERYDSDMLVRRKQIFDQYRDAFDPVEWAEVPVYETGEIKSSYHVFLLRIKDFKEEQRDRMIQGIYDRGVAVNVHFIPLPMMTYYKGLGHQMGCFPVSYDNYSRVISLPVYYDLTDDQVKQVIHTVKEAYAS